VRWRFIPNPSTWSRSVGRSGAGEVSPPVVPSRSRRPQARWLETTPPLSPVPLLPSIPLFWKTQLSLEFDGAAVVNRSRATLQSAVEVALRSRRGNGVRFGRRHFGFPAGRSWFEVAEDELPYILPAHEGPSGNVGVPHVADLPLLALGRTATGRVLGAPVEPEQGRHLALVGETGMGKSSTLVSLAHQAAELGGVVLFDPLGETARMFRAGLPPSQRTRLLWISPGSPSCGLNALEGLRDRETNAVLADRRLHDLVHALRRVRSSRYSDSAYWGPRLEEMVTAAVAAAAALPQGTLADAHTLLATSGMTRQVVPPSAQDAVHELADRTRQRPDDAEGARRLLREIARSSVLQQMLCERNPSIRAKDVVAPGSLTVISGEASTVGESVARYLLAVYLAVVWSELLGRPSGSKTFVFLDESQWFSHESLAEMLRLSRRRNVHVVLATQAVSSLPEAVADAVWTNVSDFLVFRGSPAEARELSRTTVEVTVEEILALPRGHAVALLGKGNTVEWVRTAGHPSPRSTAFSESEPVPTVGHGPDLDGPTSSDGQQELVRSAIHWILNRARSPPASSPIRIPLNELRQEVDPGGRAVRAAGALLGRCGALLAVERSASGSTWLVDPAKIPPEPEPATPLPLRGASEAPQPS
jgi:Helicase HerA, central domain